jgi:hypothetical protein
MRVFAPGFGAGAVGGYAVLRVDPAIVVPERADDSVEQSIERVQQSITSRGGEIVETWPEAKELLKARALVLHVPCPPLGRVVKRHGLTIPLPDNRRNLVLSVGGP